MVTKDASNSALWSQRRFASLKPRSSMSREKSSTWETNAKAFKLSTATKLTLQAHITHMCSQSLHADDRERWFTPFDLFGFGWGTAPLSVFVKERAVHAKRCCFIETVKHGEQISPY